jgi:hypothetical protein
MFAAPVYSAVELRVQTEAMSTTVTTRRPALALGLFLLCSAALTACKDADSDPMAVLVAAETHGALSAAEHLPALPELASQTNERSALAGATEDWRDSWTHPGDAGRATRERVYAETVPVLARELERDGVRRLLASVREVLAASGDLETTDLPPFVTDGLIVAADLADEADQALGLGDLDRALHLTLRASDRLRELAPREVAGRLIERAQGALGRNPEDATYSELDLERSRHLLVSAGEAMDDRDYVRALRRAYYACRLLGVDLE